MKTFIILAVLAVTASPAFAQRYNEQTYGNQTYIQGDNGYRGHVQTYGNQQYYNDNRGRNCNTQTYGSQSYTNCY